MGFLLPENQASPRSLLGRERLRLYLLFPSFLSGQEGAAPLLTEASLRVPRT